jgi:predicted phage-related endonuclease
MKELTSDEARIRTQLLEHLDGAEHGCVGDAVVIRADRVTQRRIDVAKLKAEFPDVADWCTRATEYITLRLP